MFSEPRAREPDDRLRYRARVTTFTETPCVDLAQPVREVPALVGGFRGDVGEHPSFELVTLLGPGSSEPLELIDPALLRVAVEVGVDGGDLQVRFGFDLPCDLPKRRRLYP